MATPDENGPLHRSLPSWVVLAASAALTSVLAVVATLSVLRVTGVLDVDVEQSVRDRTLLVGIPNTESGLRIAAGWQAAVTVPLAVTGLILTVGLAGLRQWAWEGGIGVFGLGGTIFALLAVEGLLQPTPGRNAMEGLLGGLAIAGIAGLLLSPPCRDDMDRAQTRRRVRAMRAAQAARLAGPGATRGRAPRR